VVLIQASAVEIEPRLDANVLVEPFFALVADGKRKASAGSAAAGRDFAAAPSRKGSLAPIVGVAGHSAAAVGLRRYWRLECVGRALPVADRSIGRDHRHVAMPLLPDVCSIRRGTPRGYRRAQQPRRGGGSDLERSVTFVAQTGPI